MHESFFDYLKNFSSDLISEREKAMIMKAFSPFKLRKKQYFLQAGNKCKHFAFITKGAMRQYTVDDKGVEHIARLGIEDWWMGDRESFTMFTPSAYNIDAWEDTEMLIISRPDALLLKQFPAFSAMTNILDDRNNIANQRRITSSISFSAEQRYLDFISHYPKLAARYPQHIIASYLGINKDTLSRIKRLQSGK